MAKLYKYEIGDKIECKDGTYNTIIEKTTGNKNISAYICKCEKGHLYKKSQTHITSKCPYCINQKVEKGINDISTTNKEMFSMITDKNFAYTHHDNSVSVTEFCCPICNFLIEKSPYYVKKYGLRCPRCSSGYSYGEKFMMNLLDHLEIKYITQYSSKNATWCKNYRYDFYLKDYDCIIEIQGDQHYRDTTWYTYEDIHNNDIQKNFLANNHVKNYIELDVRKSEFDYIKHSILNSELCNLLSLFSYDINWNKIQKETISPILHSIAEKYNNYSKDVQKLANYFHYSKPSIVYYLKEAATLNMCDYNPKIKNEEILKKNHAGNSERGSKPLMCIEDSKVFRNAKLLQKLSYELYNTKLDFRAISSLCNGKIKSYKKLHFKFITRQEFNDRKNNFPELSFGDKFTIIKEEK